MEDRQKHTSVLDTKRAEKEADKILRPFYRKVLLTCALAMGATVSIDAALWFTHKTSLKGLMIGIFIKGFIVTSLLIWRALIKEKI